MKTENKGSSSAFLFFLFAGGVTFLLDKYEFFLPAFLKNLLHFLAEKLSLGSSWLAASAVGGLLAFLLCFLFYLFLMPSIFVWFGRRRLKLVGKVQKNDKEVNETERFLKIGK
jgi:hypothetical protein